MNALGKRRDLRTLGIDPEPGKRVVKTKDVGAVWDVFRLRDDSGDFNKFPHLTLGVGTDEVSAMVTVPHLANKTPLRPLLTGGADGFTKVVADVLARMPDPITDCPRMAPRLRIRHRHWKPRAKPPFLDALLDVDLRTLHGDDRAGVKQLPVWIDAAFQAFETKWAASANVELQMGAAFPFATCPSVEEPEILDHIAAAWIACRPFIEKLGVDLPPEAEGT